MTEYAIIKTGGKQYRVKSGDVIDVELLDAEENGKIEFADVLLFHDGKEAKVGAPALSNFIVRGEVVESVRGPKVIAYKYKKRKNYHRKIGHRQNYTRVKITELGEGNGS
ncbi:MAG: 50S ribosomal protein L21 [Chlamydiales bacterium]|nr:50S ribosomal protein L21 [Chlamydiales bacterium]